MIKKIAILVTTILFLTSLSFAQDEDPIEVNTTLVNVNVSVTDSKRGFVDGLSKENFEVFDNGVKQKIESFSSMESPVSYGFVYDMHPTTDAATKAVLESMREFRRGLRDQDDFYTLVFNKKGSLTLDFVPNAEQVRIHLSGKPKGPTALYDAIFSASERLKQSRNQKRVLIVITDSADHNSEHRFGDIVDQFETMDASVFAVLWDESDKWKYENVSVNDQRLPLVESDATSLDRAAIAQLAMRTAGTVQSPVVQNAKELYRIYREIAIRSERQYALSFMPTSTAVKDHKLKVKLRDIKKKKGLTLSYRPGYTIP